MKRRKFVLDQSTIRVRDERRKRRIEKEIKRLQKFTATLKPIEEMQLPLKVQDEYEYVLHALSWFLSYDL